MKLFRIKWFDRGVKAKVYECENILEAISSFDKDGYDIGEILYVDIIVRGVHDEFETE